MYIGDKKKDNSIFGKDPTQALDDLMWTAEAQYSIKFWRSNRPFCLSLYYNGSNIFLFANTTPVYRSKNPKDSKDRGIKKYIIYIYIYIYIYNLAFRAKTGLNGCGYNFSVVYSVFDTSNAIDIQKYFIKKQDIK